MSIGKSIVLTALSSLVLALLGALIGFIIARFVPEYYESVFPHMVKVDDWVPVGIVLGSTQGAIGGLAVGLVLTWIFVWKEIKTGSGDSRDLTD